MGELPDEVVAAVGRVTVAAGELELVLAWIGADHAGGDASAVLAEPGEPLRAARDSIEFAEARYREAYLPVVGRAAELLARRHAVVQRMWAEAVDDGAPERWELLHYRSQVRRPAEPVLLDDLTCQLMATRDELVQIVAAQLNGSPAPSLVPQPH